MILTKITNVLRLTGMLVILGTNMVAPLNAQTLDVKASYDLIFEQDHSTTDNYLLWVDDATLNNPPTLSRPKSEVLKTGGELRFRLPSLTLGAHILYFRAGNTHGLSVPVILNVVMEETKLILPNPITGARIEVVIEVK